MLKFYATTKSERAEKGQGGNEYLDIRINTDYIHLSRILVKDDGKGGVTIFHTSEIGDDSAPWTLLKHFTEDEIAKKGRDCPLCGRRMRNWIENDKGERRYFCDECEH